MSGSDRKAVTFRLTAECRRLLTELADAKGISQAAVLELLVREEGRKESQTLKLAA